MASRPSSNGARENGNRQDSRRAAALAGGNVSTWPAASLDEPHDIEAPLLQDREDQQLEASGRTNVEKYSHFDNNDEEESGEMYVHTSTSYEGPSGNYCTEVRRQQADGRADTTSCKLCSRHLLLCSVLHAPPCAHCGGIARKQKGCTACSSSQCACSEHRWNARRHRRNLHQKQSDAQGNEQRPDKDNPFHMRRKYLYTDTQAYNKLRRVSFAVGPLFLCSSLSFGLGSIAKLSPGYFNKTWPQNFYDGLVNIPYCVVQRPRPALYLVRVVKPPFVYMQIGVMFFLAGAYCSILEVANVDYRRRVRQWQDGEIGPARPRLHFGPWPSESHGDDFLSYHGTFAQFYGAVLYAVGCFGQLYAAHFQLSQTAKWFWVQTPFLVGAAGFTVGAYLMAVEASGSWWWAFLPPPPGKMNDLGRWVQYMTIVASFLYLGGGTIGYFQNDLTVWEWQALNGSTYACGTSLFLVQSFLQTLEWLCPSL